MLFKGPAKKVCIYVNEDMVEDGLIVISDVDYTRLVRGQPLGATTNANLPTG